MRSSKVKKAKTAKYDNSRRDKQQDLEKSLQEWDKERSGED